MQLRNLRPTPIEAALALGLWTAATSLACDPNCDVPSVNGVYAHSAGGPLVFPQLAPDVPMDLVSVEIRDEGESAILTLRDPEGNEYLWGMH